MADNSTNKHKHASHAIPKGAIVKPDGSYVVKKHSHKRRRTKGQKIAITIVVILVVIILAIVGFFAYSNFATSNSIRDTNHNANVTVAESQDSGQTITYKGNKYKFNEDIVSILLIGHDNESEDDSSHTSQADMIAVAAINTKTGSIKVIGIPRDSIVTNDQYGVDENGNRTNYVGQVDEQLCLAYTYGTGTEAATNVKTSVERILYNVPIKYFADLHQDGIIELNDMIGGVTLTAIQTIPNTNIVEGETVTLLGDNARLYVMHRDTYTQGSSLQRHARQMQYIKAFTTQLFSYAKGNASNILNVFNTMLAYTNTNLDPSAVVYLAQCCITNGVNVSDVKTLSGELDTSGYYNGYILDKEDVEQTVIDTYYTPVS